MSVETRLRLLEPTIAANADASGSSNDFSRPRFAALDVVRAARATPNP